MSTVNLNIYTNPYPTVSNNIEIRVYDQADDTVVVAALNHPGPHPTQETWSFPGLPLANYLFRIFEMVGTTIVQELGTRMDVVPSAAGSYNFRATEQVVVDTTPGLVAGMTTFTFDGTGGAPDWRGWDIDTIDDIGLGPMKRGIDYAYDPVLGKFDLLQTGAVFPTDEWYNVQFAAQVNPAASSVPTIMNLFNTPKLITTNYSVSVGVDMGGLLILDPAGVYLEITLPDLNTVPKNRLLNIEMRCAASIRCCRIVTFTGQTIDWLQGNRGDLYICNQESLSLYRFVDPAVPGAGQWRVYNPFGNWHRLGEQIADDNPTTNVFNKILPVGAMLDVFQYARLYNDFVSKLGSQAVNFDDWTTGNNRYKFSLANSADPINAGKFMCADRRNVFVRNTDGTRIPGDWQTAMILAHNHPNGIADDRPVNDPANIFIYGQTNQDLPGFAKGNAAEAPGNPLYQGYTGGVVFASSGAENRPGNIAERKYLCI